VKKRNHQYRQGDIKKSFHKGLLIVPIGDWEKNPRLSAKTSVRSCTLQGFEDSSLADGIHYHDLCGKSTPKRRSSICDVSLPRWVSQDFQEYNNGFLEEGIVLIGREESNYATVHAPHETGHNRYVEDQEQDCHAAVDYGILRDR
jgi:hypothetical protein